MISHGQRVNDADLLTPDDVIVQEVEMFQTTTDVVDGRSVRQRKVVKSHPAEKFAGFKVQDFTIASITAAGADSLLKNPSVLSGNTFRTLDSIPEPVASAAPSTPSPSVDPSNTSSDD